MTPSAFALPSGAGHRPSHPDPDSGPPLAPTVSPAQVETQPRRYFNRELSWLDFNERVLALVENAELPLLERVKFAAICASNLDEFFQVRVAGLKDQLAAGLAVSARDGLSPGEQLRLIRPRVEQMVSRLTSVFHGRLVPALADAGIRLSDWEELDRDDRAFLGRQFDERIFPVLTPLAVDPGHPFPQISDLSLNLAVTVCDPVTGNRRFARVKVPPVLPRFVVLADGERFVALEQVIAAHLPRLFPGMRLEGHSSFRVTRNGDLVLEEEEADDLLAAVEMELRNRRRRKAVRLEVDRSMPPDVCDLLRHELDLHPGDVYVVDGPLDLAGLWSVYDLDRPDLKDEPWSGVTQPRLASDENHPCDIFAAIRDGDVLVHHPYDSFATSVEAFIRQAALDPNVLAIKQTLYRTSGDSPIVKALARASEQGKQVAVLVEVKARGDEQANIAWAKALEEAGVHVVYGLVGLKTHTKTALVVREEEDGIRRYCHIGTGNYNPKTARQYEDLGLLTADDDLGADLTDLFNHLTGYGRHTQYRKLLVAPIALRTRMIELIEHEASHGSDGRIVMKMNGIDDPQIIEALYAASDAGTQVDLIVRSICSLRPGVSGMSENIRVRSIVGRFLEHSRIYYFAHDDHGRGGYYTGSADLRGRNLDLRVEAVVPVTQPDLRIRLRQILDANLADGDLAWELQADGSWTPPPGAGRNAHRFLRDAALERVNPQRDPARALRR